MKEQQSKLKEQIVELTKLHIHELWRKDLDEFEVLLNATLKEEAILQEKMDAKMKKGNKKQEVMKRKKVKEG